MVRAEAWLVGSSVKKVTISGHAGYAKSGKDIVCAAVSVLAYNAINSCETLLHAPLHVVDDGDTLSCEVQKEQNSDGVQLIMQSLLLGLTETAKAYPRYLKVVKHS